MNCWYFYVICNREFLLNYEINHSLKISRFWYIWLAVLFQRVLNWNWNCLCPKMKENSQKNSWKFFFSFSFSLGLRWAEKIFLFFFSSINWDAFNTKIASAKRSLRASSRDWKEIWSAIAINRKIFCYL